MVKKLKWNLILMSLLYVGLGIFLVMKPGTALNIVCYALGGVVLACAAVQLIRYFAVERGVFQSQLTLISGLVCLGLGAFLIIRSDIVVRILPIVFGLFVIFDAIARVQNALDLRRCGYDSWKGFLLLPVLSASAAAAGAVTGGSVLGALTVLLTDVLMGLVSKCLLPLLGAFLAMSLADCLLGNQMLRRVRDLLAWAVRTGLKAALYGFTGFLAVTQVITGAADAAVNKAAKLTLSGAVPVVGSILSDASETLLASAAVLRSSVGVFGMLAVLAICLTPFLTIAVQYLLYKLAAFLAGTMTAGPLEELIDALGSAFGLMLGMTGSCALLLLISITSSVSVVVT